VVTIATTEARCNPQKVQDRFTLRATELGRLAHGPDGPAARRGGRAYRGVLRIGPGESEEEGRAGEVERFNRKLNESTGARPLIGRVATCAAY
jgi:hypothetical protein